MAVYTYDKDTPKIRISNEKCHNNDIIAKIMKYCINFQNICVWLEHTIQRNILMCLKYCSQTCTQVAGQTGKFL